MQVENKKEVGWWVTSPLREGSYPHVHLVVSLGKQYFLQTEKFNSANGFAGALDDRKEIGRKCKLWQLAYTSRARSAPCISPSYFCDYPKEKGGMLVFAGCLRSFSKHQYDDSTDYSYCDQDCHADAHNGHCVVNGLWIFRRLGWCQRRVNNE